MSAKGSKEIALKNWKRPGRGYRVLASWRCPPAVFKGKNVEHWVPNLAPSLTLSGKLRRRQLSWQTFKALYEIELKSPKKQNLLRPLALLSLRRKLILLCDCKDGSRCPNTVLAKALEECRKSRDFVLTLKGGVG